MKVSPFEKRVKRRVSGREQLFFIACTPGVKNVCLKEIETIADKPLAAEPVKGGIEVKGRMLEGLLLNLYLHSPLRILMRIDTFKADSFEKLEKKIENIDWVLYLPKNSSLTFNVTTRKSRLYHSDAIAERCKKVILKQLEVQNGFTSLADSRQTVYVNSENDKFTVSIDMSGETLFKRNIKTSVTAAPLRETLAFSMLYWAGFSTEDILLDPMCGSGTFSIEAAMMKSLIPPGFYRSFAFEQWPSFSRKAFQHVKKEAKQQFRFFPDRQIYASDLDENALKTVEENIQDNRFFKMIDVSKQDFFDLNPAAVFKDKKGVVMLNPPYGKRLYHQGDTTVFYKDIAQKLKKDFKGWRAGILLPLRQYHLFFGPGFKLYPVAHGGLDVFAAIGKIS